MRMMRRRSARLESEWSPSNLGTANSRVWGMYPNFSSLDLMRLMALLMSPWMQSSQGAFKSLQRMFFLQSISLKNWKRKESLAALIFVMAVYIFSDESASSFREFMCFSRSFSIFSQFSPTFGFTLSMKFSFTTSNKDRNSVLAFSQQAQKKRFTSRFLELQELCSLLKFFMFSRETACPLRTCSTSPKECLTVARLSIRFVSVSMFFLPFSMVLLIFLSIEVAFFSLPSIVSKQQLKVRLIRPATPSRLSAETGCRSGTSRSCAACTRGCSSLSGLRLFAVLCGLGGCRGRSTGIFRSPPTLLLAGCSFPSLGSSWECPSTARFVQPWQRALAAGERLLLPSPAANPSQEWGAPRRVPSRSCKADR